MGNPYYELMKRISLSTGAYMSSWDDEEPPKPVTKLEPPKSEPDITTMDGFIEAIKAKAVKLMYGRESWIRIKDLFEIMDRVVRMD